MPHAVEIERPVRSTKASKSNGSSSREIRQLQALYSTTRENYLTSTLSRSIIRLLESKTLPRITKIVSLGLGSFKSTDQSRRLKQLAIFLAISSHIRHAQPNLELYAQDPSFTKTDAAFLQSLGIAILSTPSSTEAGEAASVIDEETLVYSPFLTLEAYQLFFESRKLGFFLGDDFEALKRKWPKHSEGWREVEVLERRFVREMKRRAVESGEGFWEDEDRPFPMALYTNKSQEARHKPRL